MDGEPIRRGIQTRVAILVLLAALAPMALFGWASLAGVSALKETILEDRRLLVNTAALHVEAGLRAALEALAAVPAGDEPQGTIRAAQRDALRMAQLRSRLLADAFMVDRAGALVASGSIRTSGPSFALSAHPAVLAAIRRGAPDVVRDRDSGADAALYAVVPLRDATGTPAGASVGVLDPGSPAWRMLLPSEMPMRLVDGEGRLVAGPPMPPSGRDDLSSSARLTVLPWTLVLAEPRAGNLAVARAIERRWLLLAPVLAGACALFAWGVARSVKRPLEALEVAAARISRGDLSERLPSLGDDEIGRLGRSFEAMRAALLRDRARGELLRKVIGAQEEERKRIARELHDETCQTITALKIKLDEAGKAPSAEARLERIAAAQGMATRSVDELHRVIWDLRPSILDDLGLLPAIRWLSQRDLAPRGIHVRCEFDDGSVRLPAEVEIAVFRAVQEAISNVARHADAETLLIEVGVAGGILEIDVEDDGRGFDADGLGGPVASGRGLGILGMRERLELIGGKATVVSSPGAGTRVSFRVPLSEEA